MTPDVSVIIAAYNVEKYIEQAVRSALDQEKVAIEIIVADDGSTDGTAARLKAMADPRLKYIRLPGKGGPAAARNAAMAEATGAWLAILDGDDTFMPQRLFRCLIRAQRENADIIVDNILVHREIDGAEYPQFNPTSFARMKLDLPCFIKGNSNFLGGPALGYLKPIFASSFLRKNGLTYDPDLRIGEDYMLMAEALACGAGCAVEPTLGYRYTVRKGSISHRLSLDNLKRIGDGDKKFLARYPLPPAAARAQKERARKWREAYAFTKLVEAIKNRKAPEIIGALKTNPLAAWNLWRPICARLARLIT